MDRHEAYNLVVTTLASFESRSFGELEGLLGQRIAERVATPSGGEFLVDVWVEWADQRARRLRITASADSPSTFKLERVEEQIVVSEEAT